MNSIFGTGFILSHRYSGLDLAHTHANLLVLCHSQGVHFFQPCPQGGPFLVELLEAVALGPSCLYKRVQADLSHYLGSKLCLLSRTARAD